MLDTANNQTLTSFFSTATVNRSIAVMTPVAVQSYEVAAALAVVMAKYSVILAHHAKLAAIYLAMKIHEWTPVVIEKVSQAMVASYHALCYLSDLACDLIVNLWTRFQAWRHQTVFSYPPLLDYLAEHGEELLAALDDAELDLDDDEIKEFVLEHIQDSKVCAYIDKHWDELLEKFADTPDALIDDIKAYVASQEPEPVAKAFDLDKYIEENWEGLLEDIDRLIVKNLGRAWPGQAAMNFELNADIGSMFSAGQASYQVDLGKLSSINSIDASLCHDVKANLESLLADGRFLSPLQSILLMIATKGAESYVLPATTTKVDPLETQHTHQRGIKV